MNKVQPTVIVRDDQKYVINDMKNAVLVVKKVLPPLTKEELDALTKPSSGHQTTVLTKERYNPKNVNPHFSV